MVWFRELTVLKQPSIVDLKKQNEMFQKDSEKLKKILQRYEDRRKKLIEHVALEKAELVNDGTCWFLCMAEFSNSSVQENISSISRQPWVIWRRR